MLHYSTVAFAAGAGAEFRFAFDLLDLPFIHSSTAASLAAKS